jgi:hypothetical protein
MLAPRLLAVATITAATAIATAGVATAGTPTEDDRATRHDGNVTTCAEAGLAGAKQLGGSTSGATQDGITATVTDATYLSYTTDGSVTVYGAVVKGGDAYNVYPAGVTTDLRAPLTDGDQIPQISHWFLCYDVTGGGTGEAAPAATVTGTCADGFTVDLDNTAGTAEATFTIAVTGAADTTETVPAGATETVHVDAAADATTTVTVSATGMATVTRTLDCTADNGGGDNSGDNGNGNGGGVDTDNGNGPGGGTTVLGERTVRSTPNAATPAAVSPAAGTLPFTGSRTDAMLLAGLALTALGGLLVLATAPRRGRHRAVAH